MSKPYVVINDPRCTQKAVLREPAKFVDFPLSPAIQAIIKELEARFDAEENCAGLAAPQIGYNQRIIVFAVLDDPILKKFRPDLTDTMPKSIWLNPSYTPSSDQKHIDWEGCFSVNDLAAQVARFREVFYEAFTVEGKKIQGKAKGCLARLIQHEIDHLNGKLFIDYVSEEELISREALSKLRERQAKE